jgi:hypothetical protein
MMLMTFRPLGRHSGKLHFPSVWLAATVGAMAILSCSKTSAADTILPIIYVNGAVGSDSAAGNKQHPLKSLSAAIARLPDPVLRSVTIEWIGGNDATTGGRAMSPVCLELMRRMRPGATVRIVGRTDRAGDVPKMSWEGGAAMVDAREGDWWLENIQIGIGTKRQRRGVMVAGPGCVTLKNVTFRTRSLSDAAIYAHRGGLVQLRGAIKLNETLHSQAGEETFAGIIATEHGMVRFAERDGASLTIGNGSLSASYYGVIRLDCKTAQITSWGEQSNCLAVNNSGRIDLGDCVVRLCARQKKNTPIGLEHDGHVLGEGARILIEGTNDNAIVLQKASTLTCNDIEIHGAFSTTLLASSGSMFVGRFGGDIAGVSATTGATINLEAVRGKVAGPVTATRGGVVSLPDGKVVSDK